MRIALVSPLFESVPPKLYGGTERIVFFLSEALVRLGHDVTVFASADSLTSAKLVGCCKRALRLDPELRDSIAPQVVQQDMVLEAIDDFDIVHFHTDWLSFPLARHIKIPSLITLHGRLDLPEYLSLFYRYRDLNFVSISDDQRRPLPFVNWRSTVHHGMPLDFLKANARGGDYFAFLGRISPEKGIDSAIEIARRAGRKLKIAAKMDRSEERYHQSVAHLLSQPHVEYVGEISDHEKSEFLGNAAALLFPIRWPEPFGLVMIEAMATGTPVLAFGQGSVPEVIRHGRNGLIANSVDHAVELIQDGSLAALSREICRADFESRFSSDRMARDYLRVYSELVAESTGEAFPLTELSVSRECLGTA